MRRIAWFMHTTLDGYIAGPRGEMDWIRLSDDVFALAAGRTEEADTALYGRATFEMMQSHWPTAGDRPDATMHDREHSQWYNRASKVVISRSMLGKELPGVTIVGEDVAREIGRLKERDGRGIVMFGSARSAQILVEHDLIDDYWLMVNPVVLGAGVPLFAPGTRRKSLELSSAASLPSGVVGLHYVAK